jgi:transposase-like protein
LNRLRHSRNIVLERLRGEDSIAELCRREGVASSQYNGWSKEFLEAGANAAWPATPRAPPHRARSRSFATKPKP